MLNLEAMKIAAYHNNKGEIINLTNDMRDYTKYDDFYVCRNVLPKQTDFYKEIRTIQADNVHHIGLAFSNGIYTPMSLELEKQTPLIQLYAPYLRQKVLDKKLTIPQVEKILNSHFIRLRAGAYEMDITKLKRKERLFIYDYEIESITDWVEKLKYARQELMNPNKSLRVWVVNGFKFTSFDNIKKLSGIIGFKSSDAHLFTSNTYKEFIEQFNSIAEWVSSRDGIKYYFGQDINPLSNNEVVRNLCLSINKYGYTKSIGKACEFIVDDSCEVSPLNKLQKDFQYWTTIRVGDKTLKQYFMERNTRSYNEYIELIAETPYRKQFDGLCNIAKNDIKKAGWYYHV